MSFHLAQLFLHINCFPEIIVGKVLEKVKKAHSFGDSNHSIMMFKINMSLMVVGIKCLTLKKTTFDACVEIQNLLPRPISIVDFTIGPKIWVTFSSICGSLGTCDCTVKALPSLCTGVWYHVQVYMKWQDFTCHNCHLDGFFYIRPVQTSSFLLKQYLNTFLKRKV